MMKTIAIIPARGGSKRIPHKNIIDFMGKPLIAWTINAARQSELFDRIVVSTDDPEIAETAKQAGIDVPFLRQSANDDLTPVSIATIAAIKQSEEYWAEEYDIVVQLMPNCPLRGKTEIAASLNNFLNIKASFQLSCFRFGWMNPWWAFKLNKNLIPEYIFPGALVERSQDQAELFCPTGAIWIAKVEELKRDKTFYGKDHLFFPIDWQAAIDIDSYDDFEFAKAIFSLKKLKGSDNVLPGNSEFNKAGLS